MKDEIHKLLDQKVKQYNHIEFIGKDPICIPHLFTKQQDIEIAGFFAAIFAWGNRTTIINKSKEIVTKHNKENANKFSAMAPKKHEELESEQLPTILEMWKQWRLSWEDLTGKEMEGRGRYGKPLVF